MRKHKSVQNGGNFLESFGDACSFFIDTLESNLAWPVESPYAIYYEQLVIFMYAAWLSMINESFNEAVDPDALSLALSTFTL